MALLIRDIEFLVLVVPTHVREDGLVGVLYKRRLLCVDVGGFVPAQSLVRRYGEDQILRHHQKHLNDAELRYVLSLRFQIEDALLLLAPAILRLECVHTAFTVTGQYLQGVTNLFIEACDPDIGGRACILLSCIVIGCQLASHRREGAHSLTLYKPWIH